MTDRRIRPILIYTFSSLLIAFIWGNSLLPKEASSGLSSAVEEWLLRLLGIESLPFDIRKAAHFLEFAALGAMVALAFPIKEKLRPATVFCRIAIGLFVAVADESVQIFSGRGAMVSDILLDYSGYIAAFSLALIFLRLILRPKRAQ